MTKIKISAPNPGLRKVSLTTTLKAELGMSLSGAKQVTDQVIEGAEVAVEAPDRATAERAARAIRSTGAVVSVEGSAVTRTLAG